MTGGGSGRSERKDQDHLVPLMGGVDLQPPPVEADDPLHDLQPEPVVRFGAQRIVRREVELERRAAARDRERRLGPRLEGERYRERGVSMSDRVLQQLEERLAEEAPVPGELTLFSNVEDGGWTHRPNTILVDSEQLESGEAKNTLSRCRS